MKGQKTEMKKLKKEKVSLDFPLLTYLNKDRIHPQVLRRPGTFGT